jgi:hypothetical protein
MTVTIELKPEIEASLAALAAAHGLALPQCVQQVLECQVTQGVSALSPSERGCMAHFDGRPAHQAAPGG